VEIDLNKPMPEILAELSKYPIKTRLKLNGTLIVAKILLTQNQRIIRRWKTNARIF
jgi:tartrate dehydratase beta subunit/fumarate hydratase class I family protein